MAQTGDWTIPTHLQPRPEQTGFDLDAALHSMVMVHADVPEDALTAVTLGTDRIGNGVVIDADGLVLTIGYLITEAQSVWLTTHDGDVVAGHALALDQCSGFGLVLPLGRLDAPPLQRGSSSSCAVGDDVIVMGHGGRPHALNAKIVAKREFAGYWEYLLEEALFASPPHPLWGGTALIGGGGCLLGVGSLLVHQVIDGETADANLFVPVDLLEPVLDDMIRLGRPDRPARPWLGMYTVEVQERLVVGGLIQGAPAHRAGIRLGDTVTAVAGRRVSRLADMFRNVWSIGPAGATIPLTIIRGRRTLEVNVRSADRNDFLRKPRRH